MPPYASILLLQVMNTTCVAFFVDDSDDQPMTESPRFVTSEKWTDLGGSAAAESYLSEVDEEGHIGVEC